MTRGEERVVGRRMNTAHEVLNNFVCISCPMSFEPVTSKTCKRDQNNDLLTLKNLENNAALEVQTRDLRVGRACRWLMRVTTF